MTDVSVLIPAYNAEKYIARCIRSVIDSVCSFEFEIVVVDDGSTDKTYEICENFGSLIKLTKNNKNCGLSQTLNSAIKISNGSFIVRVDADDYVNQHYLEALTVFLELNEDTHAVRCDYLKVNDDEEIISRSSQVLDPIGCGIMFRRAVLHHLNGYDPNKRVNEEKCLLNRFSLAGFSMADLHIPLYRYRDTPFSLSKVGQ